MRKTLRAAALALALCSPAFAGDILCPPVAAPPSSAIQAEQTADGYMPNGLTETVLSVLESVLALL